MKKVVIAIIEKHSDQCSTYFLVASKKDFGEFTHFYYPPGGHVEPGESLENALFRECKEELGVEIRNISFLCDSEGDVPGQITYWYIVSLQDFNFTIDLEELHDADFFSIEEMRNMNIWPATKKVFEKYFAL